MTSLPLLLCVSCRTSIDIPREAGENLHTLRNVIERSSVLEALVGTGVSFYCPELQGTIYIQALLLYAQTQGPPLCFFQGSLR